MNICNLNPGEKAYIDTIINDDKKLAKRLMALGCIEGTEVTFKNTAPLGDPIIINLKGSNLALRKKDAKNICIKRKGA